MHITSSSSKRKAFFNNFATVWHPLNSYNTSWRKKIVSLIKMNSKTRAGTFVRKKGLFSLTAQGATKLPISQIPAAPSALSQSLWMQ